VKSVTDLPSLGAEVMRYAEHDALHVGRNGISRRRVEGTCVNRLVLEFRIAVLAPDRPHLRDLPLEARADD